jgi:hypothetical protein
VYSTVDDLTTGTSRFSVSGHIEICLGGSLFSICDEGWGEEEAQVACNALNYLSRNYRKLLAIHSTLIFCHYMQGDVVYNLPIASSGACTVANCIVHT